MLRVTTSVSWTLTSRNPWWSWLIWHPIAEVTISSMSLYQPENKNQFCLLFALFTFFCVHFFVYFLLRILFVCLLFALFTFCLFTSCLFPFCFVSFFALFIFCFVYFLLFLLFALSTFCFLFNSCHAIFNHSPTARKLNQILVFIFRLV